MFSKLSMGKGAVALLLVLSSVIFLNGCEPPRRNLSAEDKIADMYWLYSQFNENYAPLEYKEQRFGFNYAELKKKYLAEAAATKTNDEFYAVMYKFVSEFGDAHTSASMNSPTFPQRSKIAYLGFNGKRKGNNLLVTQFLPTMRGSSIYPVKIGDQITKLNGVALRDVVLNEMVKFRNLGQEEANLTFHMGRIFNRVSLNNGQPTGAEATLTLLRGGKELTVVVPWVYKDVLDFAQEQRSAASGRSEVAAVFDNPNSPLQQLFQLGFQRPDGALEGFLSGVAKIMPKLPNYKFSDGFAFIDDMPTWSTFVGKSRQQLKKSSSLEALEQERTVPSKAIQIAESKTYPMYVSRENASKLVAYMRLDTFSPEAGANEVVGEIKASLATLRELDVNDLIIDMVDNGGGSLELGMKLAQALTATKLAMPEMQFRLSETWLDEFEKSSLNETNDAERQLSARVYQAFREDLAAGKRLSRKMNIETLLAFPIDPNPSVEKKLNIVLMVNEMCASMCDIFTAIMKDNGLAKVVGARTMGAGGNVVNHQDAPNSHMSVRQTESLMLRGDGKTYIENNGIEPDVAMAVNESVMEKYEPVRQKAMAVLLGTVSAKK